MTVSTVLPLLSVMLKGSPPQRYPGTGGLGRPRRSQTLRTEVWAGWAHVYTCILTYIYIYIYYVSINNYIYIILFIYIYYIRCIIYIYIWSGLIHLSPSQKSRSQHGLSHSVSARLGRDGTIRMHSWPSSAGCTQGKLIDVEHGFSR